MSIFHKRMRLQRQTLIMFFAMLTVIGIAFAIYPTVRQQQTPLRSQADIEAFLSGKKWSAPLLTDRVTDTGETLTLVTTYQQSLPMVIPGAPPLPDKVSTSIDYKTYRVYMAALPDATVAILSPTQLRGGPLLVTRNNSDARQTILSRISHPFTEPAYVLTATPSAGSVIWLAAALLALITLLLYWNPLLDRYSNLGRQLALTGSYAVAADELRRELDTPLLLTGGMALTENTLLLFDARRTMVIPLSSVVIWHTEEPPAGDDEPCWSITIAWVRQQQPMKSTVLLYSQADVNTLHHALGRHCQYAGA